MSDVRTRGGKLGTVIAVVGVATVGVLVWPSIDPTDVEERAPQPRRVHLLLEVTNGVPGHILATRQGPNDPTPRKLDEGNIVESWVYDEIVHPDEMPVRFVESVSVAQAHRRGVLRCRIDVDGHKADGREVRFHANEGRSVVSCATTVE